MAGGEGVSLAFTPTWVVALVCTVIVAISFAAERLLHSSGKLLVNQKQGSLYVALLKIKEELMLFGFISLLLAVFQSRISTICIPKHFTDHWLPCNKEDAGSKPTEHFATFTSLLPGTRRLLAEASDSPSHCETEGKAPLLSLEALHDLHIFIFVLAVVHVIFTALTILFGSLQIRQWKDWENSIQQAEHDPEEGQEVKVTFVHQHSFIRGKFRGIGKCSTLLSWLHAFLKQFYGSVNKSDYTTLRLGFITNHYKHNPKFNFYKYMVRAFETDFKKVVGISWYLWIFVVLFLLLNVHGWHAYFWISFIPLILLLAVGTKLEHIIFELAEEVAQRHVAVVGELVVQPSDHHFWLHKPRLVLLLIHIILFQNAFEIAIFFWMLVLFKFNSCIMGRVGYVIPRLIIGVLVQFLCSYSILPLYAIVAHMGSSFNKEAIFEEPIQAKLTGWVQSAKKNKRQKKDSGPNNVTGKDPPPLAPLENTSSKTEGCGLETESLP